MPHVFFFFSLFFTDALEDLCCLGAAVHGRGPQGRPWGPRPGANEAGRRQAGRQDEREAVRRHGRLTRPGGKAWLAARRLALQGISAEIKAMSQQISCPMKQKELPKQVGRPDITYVKGVSILKDHLQPLETADKSTDQGSQAKRGALQEGEHIV